MADVCQVTGFGSFALVCDHVESGGYRCERIDPHTDGHVIGQHTIDHSYAGNGVQCWDLTE